MQEKVDLTRRKEYSIKVKIEILDKKNNVPVMKTLLLKQLEKYDISKDSTKYKYNIHMLDLVSISEIEFLALKDNNNWIHIELRERSGKIYSKKRFKMLAIHILKEHSQVYNIQVIMMSELPYVFAHSHEYAKISTLNTQNVFTGITAHQLLSTILQTIQTDSSTDKKIAAHWNDLGKVPQYYPSIRLLDTYSDINLFDYLFENFPPYLFEPYFIFDDLHIPKIIKKGIETPYNIIVNNLYDITSFYDKVSMKSLTRITPQSKTFISSVPLIDKDTFYKTICSTIILTNGAVNKVHKIEPMLQSDSDASGNIVKNINSTLDPDVFVRRIQAKKILVDKNASIESYKYTDIDISDISFLSSYNITDNKVYDHVPLTIEYSFLKNPYSSFWVTVHVQYAKVPDKIY